MEKLKALIRLEESLAKLPKADSINIEFEGEQSYEHATNDGPSPKNAKRT